MWEVETPSLSHATVTDPHILSIVAPFKALGSNQEESCYLQTSPEYAMKRLLAAGSGSIFQISKAFRQGEIGKLHNPEFSMLEWYRLGFDHHALMDEVDELLQTALQLPPAMRMSVADAYDQCVGINPHTASVADLKKAAEEFVESYPDFGDEKNNWLDLLFTHCIESQLGQEAPLFLYDFPESQAALAKVRPESPPVASRFELYYKGVELANGFHELQDAAEQKARFEMDLKYRERHELPIVPMDERFLAALANGLPDCAGVALGIDRLIMLVLGCERVAATMSFGFSS